MHTYTRVKGLLLLLLASGLTACAAQPLVRAEQTTAIPTDTLRPLLTYTATKRSFTPISTRAASASPTPTSTHRAAPSPTATEVPITPEPTVVLTPDPLLPLAADGVSRTADVPILMYHYISAPPSANDRIRYGLSVPPEMFEAQLRLLSNYGFHTITLRELYEYLAIGKTLPDNPIVLTFDDGYVDNYTNAFPLLRKYGMRGTFFILTGPADEGNPNYLSWDMVQAMSGAGMDMQLHSRDHLDMRNRSYEWLVFQIIGGRQSIEGHTGQPVIFMAYPSGRYDANVVRFLQDSHFWGAVTTAFGTQHELSDALTWDRVRIAGQLRLSDFARLLGINLNEISATARPSATSTATPQPTATPTSAIRGRPTLAGTPASPQLGPTVSSRLRTPTPKAP